MLSLSAMTTRAYGANNSVTASSVHPLVNAMTVDVEDYFQVSAFQRYIARASWDQLPRRVEKNTDRILELFAERKLRATFFVLGWIAERHPQLVHRIVNAGHELACHGYSHVRITEQTPEEFRQDVERAKKFLEDVSGSAVIGYRAPTYSIVAKTLWALDILDDVGFKYSSSIYPVKHDLYGMPDASRFAFLASTTGKLMEFPVTTVRFFGRNYPCGGGGYFRLFPYAISRWALARVNSVDHQACIFYFHPWEIDPGQPRQRGIDFKTGFRHYLNLSRMEGRLRRLVEDFRWDTMANVFFGARDSGN